ncbi:MAG: hypothetical protein RI884_1588 [Pseudomonadota bacterium]|jgi:lysine-N-methylase
MNPKYTVSALVPAVNTSFKCLGSECPDNCCTGWRVPIDQTSYLAYKKSVHPELQPLFETRLHPEKTPTPQHYGTIELKKQDHACSFIEGGWCKIQKHLGEDALSDTCTVYPRITVQHGDLFQQGLTLSCPDAAHRILLQDEMTEFVQAPVATREHQIHRVNDPSPAAELATRDVRFFTLRILRQAHLPLWQRMAVLGFFCEEAALLQARSDFASFAGLMARYEEMLASESLPQTLAGIASYPQLHVQVFAGILVSKLLKATTPHQGAVLGELADGIAGLTPSAAPQVFQAGMLEKYVAGTRNLERALAGKPHFMTNFLVNQMFNEAFPFNEPRIFESYIRLVSRFGSLRMLLALRCSDEKKLPTPQQLADLAQVYARLFEHDPLFQDAINQALQTAGFESMKYIAGVLRD